MKKSIPKLVVFVPILIAVIGLVYLFTDSNEPMMETVDVDVVSEKTLIPGGHSVGIKMDVKGVLVVGLEEIETENSIVIPGLDAVIQIVDIILSINDE